MKRYDDILRLADRFLDGRTSLAEEQELASFFARNKAEIPYMPETLQVLAEMMQGFELATPSRELKIENGKLKMAAWRRWLWAASAAACVAAVLAFALWHSAPTDSDGIAELENDELPTLFIAFYAPESSESETLPEASEPTIAQAPAIASVVEPEEDAAPDEPILLPMAYDDGIQAVMQECELALLEAQFQSYKEDITYVKI